MTSDLSGRARPAAATALLGGAVLLMLLPGAAGAVERPGAANTTGASSTLSVHIDGWGSGTVTSNPAGIDCHLVSEPGNPYEDEGWDQRFSGPCSASFPVGTVVTLTGRPDAGSSLNGPMDCGTQTGNPCKRTVGGGYNAVWAMFCPDGGLCSAG